MASYKDSRPLLWSPSRDEIKSPPPPGRQIDILSVKSGLTPISAKF
jgi:hypothetical protein